MKIVQINVAAGITSTGHIVDQIAEVGTAMGHECWIAHSRGQARVPERAITIGSRSDMLIHAMHTRLTDRHGLASKGATNRLIRQIEQLAPDVLHIHNIHGYFINYEVLMQWLAATGLPVVWTLHDCWAFTGHCAYPMGCQRWRQGACQRCPLASQYPATWGTSRAAENIKSKEQAFNQLQHLTLVTPSQWLADQVKQTYLKRHRLLVIPNGIDTQAFTPGSHEQARQWLDDRYGTAGKRLIMGAANRWDPRRGMADFVSLANTLPTDQYAVMLVGTNKKIDNVITVPYVESQAVMAQYYRGADVYVNPTYGDNYPTTNLEAQACGTPVITYATGGAAETLRPGAGWAIKAGDIAEVARRVALPLPRTAIDSTQLDYHQAFAAYYSQAYGA